MEPLLKAIIDITHDGASFVVNRTSNLRIVKMSLRSKINQQGEMHYEDRLFPLLHLTEDCNPLVIVEHLYQMRARFDRHKDPPRPDNTGGATSNHSTEGNDGSESKEGSPPG